MVPQQYCLRWKHHHSNVQTMFAQLLEKERFCDVTLYCSPSFLKQIPEKGDLVEPDCIRGVSLRAHRVVLAACSELLGSLLGAHESLGEPVLVIDGAEPGHVRALLDYMYTGECHVQHSELPSLLKTAEELRIKGLTDIRWNNKDEPPDSQTGAISTTTSKADIRTCNTDAAPSKNTAPPKQPTSPGPELELRPEEKYNVNGGPPPLIKLPSKEKSSPVLKRDPTPEADAPSPKRQRMLSNNENSEDEDNEQEWHHGSLDISASRVINWGAEQDHSGGELSRGEGGGEDDDWGDAPADIGSFLDTRLRVDGDNSGDEDSDDGAPPSTSSSIGTTGLDIPSLKGELTVKPIMSMSKLQQSLPKPALGPKSGPSDPRFTDVIKLNDYLRHGRRPQFWEEEYVKRVMESVRLKELEMKQAAEILGVSYGTLYGRYRDVYGCINRPYRNARDFWGSKGPSEVLDRLQRGEISLDVAAQALGVTASHLAAYMADLHAPREKEFEPIPIEIDPSLKIKTPPFSASATSTTSACPIKSIQKKMAAAEKAVKKILIGSMQDEDSIPATVISNVYGDALKQAQATVAAAAAAASGKWPSIRVANLDTLRASSSTSPGESTSTSPTLLMKTRPDLTIVAAKKQDAKKDDENGT